MSKSYDVLGVDAGAGEETIRAAFRRAAKACHPDLNGGDRAGERRLRRLIAARDYLLGHRRRLSYAADTRLSPLELVTPRYKRTPLFAGALTAAGFLVFLLFLSGHPYSAQPAFTSFDSQIVEADAETNIPDAGSAEIKAIRDTRELYSVRGGVWRKPVQDIAPRDKFGPRAVSKPHTGRTKSVVSEAASQASRTWRKLAWRLHGT